MEVHVSKGMKKTDFEAVAGAIKEARDGTTQEVRFAIDNLARAIADYATERYPRFKRGKFLEQCGGVPL